MKTTEALSENGKKVDDDAEDVDTFQEIMCKVGLSGKFQKIYNLIFVMTLSMAGAMMYMNIILALNIPDHWCNVPGRENTNLTLEEWRKITLPTEKDNRGSEKYSSCLMFNENFTHIKGSTNADHNVTGCQNGWSFDQTWFDSTIPSQENWVCEKDLYVTNIFVVSRITEVIGAFVFGQLGDICGRRFVYYISVICASVGRFVSIFTTSSYTLFLIFSCIAALTVNSLFQSPQVIGMEISRDDDRSTIAVYQSFGWSIGTTAMPLLFWWSRDWVTFMWLTTLPTAVILIFYKYVIESPRWLISRRRFSDAIAQFKTIAKINGNKFDMSEKELADMFPDVHEEAIFGMLSLFSGYRLAKNTIIVGFSWCVVAVSYFTLVLFSSRMAGNPFLNFLLQSIVEIPAYIVGKYISDVYGRRLTNSLSFLVSFIVCIPIIMVAKNPEHESFVVGFGVFIKFLNAVTFFVASLQAMEIYPTCMRQTGISLGSIVASAVGVLAPYLVYLGTTYDIRYPYYILATLFFIGGTSALFLPETLHHKLPDSLEEARVFGKNQKFFSIPKPQVNHKDEGKDIEKLNQAKYAP